MENKLKWSEPVLTKLGQAKLSSGARCTTGGAADLTCGSGGTVKALACAGGYSPSASACSTGGDYSVGAN